MEYLSKRSRSKSLSPSADFIKKKSSSKKKKSSMKGGKRSGSKKRSKSSIRIKHSAPSYLKYDIEKLLGKNDNIAFHRIFT